MPIWGLINTRDRKIIAILILIMVSAGYYGVSSRNDDLDKIRSLTDEIDANVDSLKIINYRFDSLQVQYTEVYDRLNKTKNQLDTFKLKLSTIMGSNIRNVNSINNQLLELLREQNEYEKVEVVDNDFRF